MSKVFEVGRKTVGRVRNIVSTEKSSAFNVDTFLFSRIRNPKQPVLQFTFVLTAVVYENYWQSDNC